MRGILTSPDALNEYMDRLGIPASGRRLIERAHQHGPARKVQSNGISVVGAVQSEKMGQPIPYESRTLEYPAIVLYEHDPKVAAYFAQPFQLDLKLTDGGTKKPFRLGHYPDFLVLRDNEILVEEWRESSRLQRIQRDHPGRLSYEQDGWHWPDVEEHLQNYGFTYRIRTRDSLPDTYLANVRFLADYFHSSSPPLSTQAREALSRVFGERLSIPLHELIDKAKAVRPAAPAKYTESSADVDNAQGELAFTTDDIYKSIALNLVGFNLSEHLLSDPSRSIVYRDPIAREFCARIDNTTPALRERRDFSLAPGASVLYDGMSFEVALAGATRLLLRRRDSGDEVEVSISSIRQLFDRGELKLIGEPPPRQTHEHPTASPKEVEAALTRVHQLNLAKTAPEQVAVSTRTLQRYRRAMAEAGASAIEQNLALVPRFREQGNRRPKLPQEVLALIETTARDHFNTAAGISKRTAYRLFVDACHKQGLSPCSERIFNIRIGSATNIEARVGRRLADRVTPLPLHLEFSDPVHGVRAWEYVHFDHTEIDLELKAPDGTPLRKAWLSLAICTATRRIVGFYLSFSAPSYVSCMMLLRDIVRRHGRLPETIVVDNGPDFRSKSFKRVLELYGVNTRWRPKGRPRYGSVMERVFGTTNTQFVHNLNGNTKLMKHARSVTRSVRPDAYVEWTLVALHGALKFFFERLYGNAIHPAYGETPNDRFARLVHEAGARMHKWIRYDTLFRIETCPEPDSGCTRVVDHVRGIKVNNAFYYCDAFRRQPGVHGAKVEVRVEPWDPSVVYALVDNSWHTCRSRSLAKYSYASEVELRYALEEAARRSGIARRDVTPERVQEWLQILEAENFDPRLRLRQQEMRLVYAPLEMLAADAQPDRAANEHPEPSREAEEAVLEEKGAPEMNEDDDEENDDEFGLLR